MVTDTFAAVGPQDAGLQVGDVIQEVNRQTVRSVDDVQRVLDQASQQSLVLLVNRGGTTACSLGGSL